MSRQNDLDNINKFFRIKTLKAGLRRLMHGDIFPNTKLPFNNIWFLGNFEKLSLKYLDDIKFMFLMTLSFSAFLHMIHISSYGD